LNEWDSLLLEFALEAETLANPRMTNSDGFRQLHSGPSGSMIGEAVGVELPSTSAAGEEFNLRLLDELFPAPESELQSNPASTFSVASIESMDILNVKAWSENEHSSPLSTRDTLPSRETSSPSSDLGVARHSRAVSKPRTQASRRGPSRFCHICWSGSENRRMIPCVNLSAPKKACRKVVCEKCALKHFPDMKPGQASVPCPHCLGICPQKSQCSIYKATNDRRRVQRQARALSYDAEQTW